MDTDTNILWECYKAYVPVHYGKVNGVVLFSIHPVVRTKTEGTDRVDTEVFVIKTTLPGIPPEITCSSPYVGMTAAELIWVSWIDKMGLMLK